MITWAADEHLVLIGAIGFWSACHLLDHRHRVRGCADQLLLGAIATTILPLLLKPVFRRRRPDRTVVHGHRHGIPKSGHAYQSFPSGHAMHLGAVAAALARGFPATRRIVWPLALGLATTRIALLAHYVTDVLAGLAISVAIDALLARTRRLYCMRKMRATPRRIGRFARN